MPADSPPTGPTAGLAGLAGRTFPPTEVLEVGEDRIAAFAAATGTPYVRGGPAPATFPIVVAFAAMRRLMEDPETGIDLQHVVHGDQRFVHERAVVAGDRLTAELTVEGLRRLGGADVITTSTAVTDDAGALVCTAKATLVHTGGA